MQTICRIESYVIQIPYVNPVRGHNWSAEVQTSLFVRVETRDGCEGWGEADPTPSPTYPQAPKLKEIVDRFLAAAVMGTEAGNFGLLHQKMDAAISGYRAAKAAVEMACYDLFGKIIGAPVWKLIGGKIREEISIIGWIGAGTIENAKEQAKQYVDGGFETLKVKVGYGPESDEARIRAIREIAGSNIALRVDANNAYTRDDAWESLKRLEKYEIAHYEDPIHREDVEGMAWLRRKSSVPIMADGCCIDPADLIRVIRADAADIVKLSVQINGGIYKTVQMMQIAAAAGMPATLGHSFCLTTNILSEVHVGASAANLHTPCEFVGLLKITDDVVEEPLDLTRKRIKVPDRPGLGVEISRTKLERYRLSVEQE